MVFCDVCGAKMDYVGIEDDGASLFDSYVCGNCGHWQDGRHHPVTPEPAKRIQRSRASGWVMPERAIYVGRPSKWGNPFKVEDFITPLACLNAYQDHLKKMFYANPAGFIDWLTPLRGHDLSCWCRLRQPCHADILLGLANHPTLTDHPSWQVCLCGESMRYEGIQKGIEVIDHVYQCPKCEAKEFHTIPFFR